MASGQACVLVEDIAPASMGIISRLGFRGKFYALSLQGTLAVIEVVDSRSSPNQRFGHFREYFLESEGEILLIFLISKKLVQVVNDVEVFRLNLLRLSWIQMQSLGDQTLFVGENLCVSISANKV
ncbi:hypothetical protein I3843_06G152100 [Carya illinoinensis]|nr:hypothetical protein I3760_06G160700 [Carya illinoinensis]KAG7976505.1 hypothetical protein I3843_06G152100 [Carya illinoinensis]